MKYLRALQNTLRSFSSPHPLRDWLLLLSIATLALIALFGVSLYLFMGIRSGNSFSTASGWQVSVPRVPRAELESLVKALEARKLEYESGTVSAPNFSDPSR